MCGFQAHFLPPLLCIRRSLAVEREWWDFHFCFLGNAFLSCSDGWIFLIRCNNASGWYSNFLDMGYVLLSSKMTFTMTLSQINPAPPLASPWAPLLRVLVMVLIMVYFMVGSKIAAVPVCVMVLLLPTVDARVSISQVVTIYILIPFTVLSMTIPGSKVSHSVTPLPLRSKSVSHLRMLPKVESMDRDLGRTHVYLNVYDLTPVNGYFYWAGLGVFHTGIEVHGVEYGFGAHDYPTTGVFEVEPRKCPGFKFKKSIFMGTTYLDPFQFREFMEYQSSKYNGDTYNLILKNCNHFCGDICFKLTGRRIPQWVNRLARIGSLCNWILPKALKASAMRHNPNLQGCGGENNRLTRSFSCFSSISMHQKERQVSMSSLFLHTHYKGCLPPWEVKKSQNGSSEE